jgi:hypothetical protein
MKQRATYHGLSLVVDMGSDDLPLVYGPRSAGAYDDIQARRAEILARRDRTIEAYRPVYRTMLRLGWSRAEINLIIREQWPDDWRAMCPYRELARLGFEDMREAALLDTWDYYDGAPWEVCDSPQEAWQRFGNAALSEKRSNNDTSRHGRRTSPGYGSETPRQGTSRRRKFSLRV